MNFFLLLLCLLLDSDSFRIREAATAALTRLAPLCWEQLLEYAGPTEARVRCWSVAEAYWRTLPLDERLEHTARLRPRGWHKLPWLSSLPSWNTCYLEQAARQGYINNRPDWPVYRVATRLWLIDMTTAGYTLRELQALLEAMARVDEEWCRKHLEPSADWRR